MLRTGRLSPRDVVRTGAGGLRARPMRVFLSALGIAIGIAAMIGVVGISTSGHTELRHTLASIRYRSHPSWTPPSPPYATFSPPPPTPEAPTEVTVSRPSDALAAKGATDQAFTGLMLGLGGVALLVGGVGVANTMVISVLERRAEIGLRRALGGRRGHIRTQFLAESQILAGLYPAFRAARLPGSPDGSPGHTVRNRGEHQFSATLNHSVPPSRNS